tara:strand:- start:181 stop:489 length:309 start_codon:yes stop_codon:yes gene_type:complete
MEAIKTKELAMKVQTLEKENRELRSALADAEAKQRYLEQDFEAVTEELDSMVEENHVELKQLRQTEDALVTATRRWVQIHFEDFSELLEKRVKAIETHLWEV